MGKAELAIEGSGIFENMDEEFINEISDDVHSKVQDMVDGGTITFIPIHKKDGVGVLIGNSDGDGPSDELNNLKESVQGRYQQWINDRSGKE